MRITLFLTSDAIWTGLKKCDEKSRLSCLSKAGAYAVHAALRIGCLKFSALKIALDLSGDRKSASAQHALLWAVMPVFKWPFKLHLDATLVELSGRVLYQNAPSKNYWGPLGSHTHQSGHTSACSNSSNGACAFSWLSTKKRHASRKPAVNANCQQCSASGLGNWGAFSAPF
eukprot:scaffold115385_cov19-Tisochrysis_lutea.AAC.2